MNKKSRPKIKHHICQPFPFKLKGQAYPRCRICGRAMKPNPMVLLKRKEESERELGATSETKRILDEILQAYKESIIRPIVITRKR